MKKSASLLVALTSFIAVGAHADPATSGANIAQWYSNDMNLPLSQLYPGSNVGEGRRETTAVARTIQSAAGENVRGTPGQWAANDMNVPMHVLYPGSVLPSVAAEGGKTRQEVFREYQQAKAAGEIRIGETNSPEREVFPHAFATVNTRRAAE